MVAGPDAPTFGEGKNSWLTGTAAWTMTAVSQYILGIRPTLDGLAVDPVLPDEVGDFAVTRKYRDNTYRISVKKAGHATASAMTVDGKAVAARSVHDPSGRDLFIIPPDLPVGEHEVVVTL